MVVGTPLYMSPEQLSGEKLDPRSDIYSFALIVYQMMTGGLPFQGENAQALMVKRLTDNPLPMKSVNPRVNVLPAVEAIVLAALARDRRNRTQSIRNFVEQLEQAAKTDPSTAKTLINNTAQNRPAPATGQNQMGGTTGGGGYYTPSQNPRSGSQPGVSNPSQGAALSTPTPPGSMPPYGQPQTPPQSMPQMKQPSGQQYYQPPNPTPPNPVQPMVGGVQTPRQPTPGQPMPMPFPTPPGVQPPVQPQKKSRAGLWISLILVFFVVVVGSCAVIIYTISDNTTVSNNSNNSSNNGETQKQTGDGSDYVDNTDSQTVDIDKNSSGSATALEHYNKGVTLLDEKDYNSAAAEFKLALQLQSDYREAQENLAISLYYASQYKEAIKEARRAIEVYGGSRAQSYEVLGRAQYDDRQYMQAAQSFLQAASLDPNNLEVRVLAAFALDLAGQSATANQMYDNFIENYPTHYLATQINNIKQGDRPPAVLPKP
ncbi:MAG: hypothetical protein JNN15_03665, partial [Blastocatellia bacterium]|nr:hypothetical protein [Blastocatellia bacterium]